MQFKYSMVQTRVSTDWTHILAAPRNIFRHQGNDGEGHHESGVRGRTKRMADGGTGHADQSTTKLYDQRGYNPEKSAESLRQPLLVPEPTNGSGSAQLWQPCTPAMAAGLTDHAWPLKEVLCYRVSP